MQPRWMAFEKFVMDYHRRTLGRTTYHWPDVPERVLVAAGYLAAARLSQSKRGSSNRLAEYGLDGIACEVLPDGTEVHHGIQAKHWGASRQITAADLGTFLVAQQAMTATHPASRGYLYFTGRLEPNLAGFMASAGYVVTRMPRHAPLRALPRPLQAPVCVTPVGVWVGR